MTLTAISSDAIHTKAWNAIYQILNENKGSFGETVKTITSAFPDKAVTTKASYPIIVLPPITAPQVPLTMGKEETSPLSVIEIYTTRADHLDTLASNVYYYITQNKDELRIEAGMPLKNITAGSPGTFMRSGMKVHYTTIVLNFRYIYAR